MIHKVVLWHSYSVSTNSNSLQELLGYFKALLLATQLSSKCPLKLSNYLIVRNRLARLVLLDHLWLLIDHLLQHITLLD